MGVEVCFILATAKTLPAPHKHAELGGFSLISLPLMMGQ